MKAVSACIRCSARGVARSTEEVPSMLCGTDTFDPEVPDGSLTETYAQAVLNIDNSRWRGVPFIVKCAPTAPTSWLQPPQLRTTPLVFRRRGQIHSHTALCIGNTVRMEVLHWAGITTVLCAGALRLPMSVSAKSAFNLKKVRCPIFATRTSVVAASTAMRW
eukprot:COSAG01_NODE_428_length_17193_cov_45.999123_8_plen_162_part_00